MSEAGRRSNQPRSPPGLPPAGADPLLQRRRELTRKPPRPARAIEEARQRAPRFLTGLVPASPPTMSGRRRDAEAPRSRSDRATLFDCLDERETAGKSELGLSVQIHPSPPSGVGPRRPTASKEGRIDLS